MIRGDGRLISKAMPTLHLPQSNQESTSNNFIKYSQRLRIEQDHQEASTSKAFINTIVQHPSDISGTACTTENSNVANVLRPRPKKRNTNLKTKKIEEDYDGIGLSKLSETPFKNKYNNITKKLRKEYKGNSYHKQLRLFHINLYSGSPSAYKIFQYYFSLPSPQKLKNTTINLPPGINENFLKLIGMQLKELPATAKYITVYFYEMPLKKNLYYDIRQDAIFGFQNMNGTRSTEIANSVLIIKFKGCFHMYEQLIGYGLVNSSYDLFHVSEWLKATIQFLLHYDFVVCSVVANQTTNMSDLAKLEGVTPMSPFITVDNKKILFLFDIPHLMLGVRDILLKKDISYEGNKLASWNHVVQFYNNDTSRNIKLAPKLTIHHIDPPLSERKKVKLMKQVFSYSVATGIAAGTETGIQAPEALKTADFIFKMNYLYDVLCSNIYKGDEHQHKCLIDAYSLFSEVINTNNGIYQPDEIDCIQGMLMSIKAVLEMHKYFVLAGINAFPMKKFHLNPEVLFSKLDSKRILKKKTDQMTAIQFIRSFSKLALEHLLNNNRLKNGIANLESLISDEENNVENHFTLLEEYFINNVAPLKIQTKNHRKVGPNFEDIYKFLLNKSLTVHNECETLKTYIGKSNKVINDINYDGQFMSSAFKYVLEPPKNFREYVDQCEKCFNSDFNRLALLDNVGATLLEKMNVITPVVPCPCFPLDYLNKLFLRLRIYQTLKSILNNLKN